MPLGEPEVLDVENAPASRFCNIVLYFMHPDNLLGYFCYIVHYFCNLEFVYFQMQDLEICKGASEGRLQFR